MRQHFPVIAGGLAVLALGVALVVARADENEAKDTVLKLADMIEKGGSPKADGLDKLDLNDAMGLLKLRNKGGLGLGPKAGAFPANQDGIEAKIIGLAKTGDKLTAADLKKQGADLEKAAYIS